MAVTAMSTVTKQILFQSGEIPHDWARTNGTDIKPGMIVTKTGETITTPDIDIPGAVDEISYGVVGLLLDHDIDTAYGDNVFVPLHQKGSGDVVWMWCANGDGDKVQGAPIQHSHAGADGIGLGGELMHEYLGQAYRDADVDATDDTPMLLLLQ